MELGRLGVWWSGSRRTAGTEPAELGTALEEAGYSAFWSSGGFEPGLLPRFGQLLDNSRRLVVASGIASIWVTPAEQLAAAVAELEDRHPGRFLLGLGVSHGPIVRDYERPYAHMVDYLDRLDRAERPVPADRRVLAALGPKMLELSATRAAGAHPYFVPVEHTERARSILGPGPLLAPEVTAVVETDPARARAVAREFTTGYLSLPNYARNLRRLGYSEDDVAGGGSDRLVDAVVAWGDPGTVAGRLRAHLEAGADQVCLQLLGGGDGFPLDAYRQVAAAFGPS